MNARRYRAILIGNSRFVEPQLDNLSGPPHDLPVLAGILAHAERGLFAAADVHRVAERPRLDIESAIEDFFAEAAYDDVLLFYYSGHGVLNTEGELFLCAADTNLSRLRSTAIGSQWLNSTITDSAARTVVIMLDCCHSGAFKGGDITAPLATGSGRFVLTSSRGPQLSVDTAGAGVSAFTAHLVDGLRGAAGAGRDITVHELYQYTHRAMAGYGKQEPQFRVTGAGELIIARRDDPAPGVPEAPPRLSVAAVRFPEPDGTVQDGGRGGVDPGAFPDIVRGALSGVGMDIAAAPSTLRMTSLVKARRDAAIPAGETTVAYLPLAGSEVVVFTDIAVYWTDAHDHLAVRYLDFPGRTFTESGGRVSFGDGVPRPVGFLADMLTQALNLIARALTR